MLEGFLKTIGNHLEAIKKTYTRVGKLSTSSITGGSAISGAGVIKKIQIKDSLALDATIAINIDGAGVQTLSLATMYRIDAASGFVSGGMSEGMVATGSTGNDVSFTINIDLPFRTSLDISISNADAFCIFWEEEV